MLRSALLAVALATIALAAPQITSPAEGASVSLRGGSVTVEWKDDGKAPKSSQLESYLLQLIVGGNLATDSVSGAILVLACEGG